METMMAAVVYGKGDMRYEAVEKPAVQPNSFRLKVKACAICGSDKRIYRIGDFRANYPVIIGHEIAGIVDAVAPGVTQVKVGDRVTVAPGFACGKCRFCKAGSPNLCENPYPSMGYTLNGGFAEYLDVPPHILREGFVNPIPENLSFEEACLAEIIACALNAQHNVQVSKGDQVLIIGAGPAGIIHAHLAKMYGAEKVTIAQRSAYRLEQARDLFGDVVDDTICMGQEDLETAYLKRNENRAPDVIFVCAPSAQAQETACRMIGPKGRINFFGGLPAGKNTITLDANRVHYMEYKITGASSSRQIDNQQALEILSKGIIDGKKLITRMYPLRDIVEAFQFAEEKNCIKVVIRP